MWLKKMNIHPFLTIFEQVCSNEIMFLSQLYNGVLRRYDSICAYYNDSERCLCAGQAQNQEGNQAISSTGIFKNMFSW